MSAFPRRVRDVAPRARQALVTPTPAATPGPVARAIAAVVSTFRRPREGRRLAGLGRVRCGRYRRWCRQWCRRWCRAWGTTPWAYEGPRSKCPRRTISEGLAVADPRQLSRDAPCRCTVMPGRATRSARFTTITQGGAREHPLHRRRVRPARARRAAALAARLSRRAPSTS